MSLFRKPPPSSTLDLGDFTVEVQRKRIKNLNLRVHAPDGSVRISVPWYASLDSVREFALSKLEWLKKQRKRIQELQPRPTPRYLDGDSIDLWGERYRLKVEELAAPRSVHVGSGQVVLRVRPGTPTARHEPILDAWYRDQVQAELPALFAEWERRLGVRSQRILLQKMKSRWGTCQPSTGTIRLNTELAKKPRDCLIYVVVHELAHLIEASHGPRFVAVMDRHLPRWRETRDLLNGRHPLPL